MTLLLLTLATIFVSSCATTNTNLENRDLEQLYQGAGTERYFLPDLPVWANFSSSSSCKRDEITRYLNFSSIRDSYALSYAQILHFQQMLNRRFLSFTQSSDRPLYLKDEAFIFYNVYEQVAGGGRDLLIPQFQTVSLIWLDPLLADLDRVSQVLESPDVLKGHPVLVSSCLNSFILERLTEKFGWDKYGVKLIGQEMFSPYLPDFSLGHDYYLDFLKLLPGKKLRLFAPRKPPHFLGIESFIKI